MDERSTEKPNCFIVMPFGREPAERKWFKGWYEVVIAPAVVTAGHHPVLSAAEEQPGAINDEIRTHLAYDPMVLVDLGGADPEDDPNPNVMYELGIRHALGMPLVIMAWEGQRLPFDVSNQRVIMLGRDLLDIEANKKKIVSFIQSAAEGKYYRPMDAVGRIATIAAASASLSEDSLLAALAQEVRELKGSFNSSIHTSRQRVQWQSILTVKTLLRGKLIRKELFSYFVSKGGYASTWPKFLKEKITDDFAKEAGAWSESQWKAYIDDHLKEIVINDVISDKLAAEPRKVGANPLINEEIIESVKNSLPAQPWTKGIHAKIIEELNITKKQYDRAVAELIKRKVFRQQIDGILLDTDD